MELFAKDCLRLGCLKGFVHFNFYLRGREELLVVVHSVGAAAAGGPGTQEGGGGLRSDQQGAPVSNGQGGISFLSSHVSPSKTFDEGGVPPASPASNEMSSEDNPDDVVFLVGGYARYKCPYVWLRSPHPAFQGKVSENAKDLPLQLKTTDSWKKARIRVWDIIAELCQRCIEPPPENPFEVDWSVYERMTRLERTVGLGALCSFMRDVVLAETPYSAVCYVVYCEAIDRHTEAMGYIRISAVASSSNPCCSPLV